MAFPPDLECGGNNAWDELVYHFELQSSPEPEYQEECLQRFKEKKAMAAGIDTQLIKQLRHQVSSIHDEVQELEQEQNNIADVKNTIMELGQDVHKLEEYVASLKRKLDHQKGETVRCEQTRAEAEQKRQQLIAERNRLMELKQSQNLTAEELVRLKNHVQLTAATHQRLLEQGNQVQEKIWNLEMLQCKAQVTQSELVHQYNSSDAAAVGNISTIHSTQSDSK